MQFVNRLLITTMLAMALACANLAGAGMREQDASPPDEGSAAPGADESAPRAEETATGGPTPRSGRPLIASSGERLWFVQAQAPPLSGFRLVSRGEDDRNVAVALILQERPEALIAVENEVYFIFPPTIPSNGDSPPRRLVKAIRAVSDPLDGRRFDPPDRGRIIASLPGFGRLTGVASGNNRPYVLLGAHESPQGAEAEASSPGQTTLLQLVDTDWVEAPLPEPIAAAAAAADSSLPLRLLNGRRPTLIVPGAALGTPGDGDGVLHTLLFELEESGEWQSRTVEVAFDAVESAAGAYGHTILAMSGQSPEELRLALLRGADAYQLSVLDNVAPARTLISFGAEAAIVEMPGPESLPIVHVIDLSTGEPYREIPLNEAPLVRREDFGAFVLIGGLLLAALVMFLFRPDPTSVRVTLPPDTRLAEPSRRLYAMAIDLFPCGLLVKVVMDVSAADLFHIPLVTRDWESATPALLTIAVTVIYTTIAEMISGRTLGKWIFELRVVSIDGGRPKPVQILVRNAMRAIALLIPPLVVFVLWNPHRQRLGDLAARTIVVVEMERPEDERAERDRTRDENERPRDSGDDLPSRSGIDDSSDRSDDAG